MSQGNKKTILVADDEDDIRDIMRLHLESEGYNVITSKNGEEAINALNEFDISLAITDLKMPKMDGFEVLDYIRNHNSYIPVIVLTGYVDTDTVVMSMKKGAADYLPKPVKRDEFIDVVRSILGKKGIPTVPKPFEIAGLYLIDKGGVLLHHQDVVHNPEFDVDIFGSMFTAVKTFISDSFPFDGGLKIIEHGSYKILVEEGFDFFLVVVGRGDLVDDARSEMMAAVKSINERYGDIIARWDGNEKNMAGIDKELTGLIRLVKRGETGQLGGGFKKKTMGREFKKRLSNRKNTDTQLM